MAIITDIYFSLAEIKPRFYAYQHVNDAFSIILHT